MKTTKDLHGKTYIHCCACMSVWADALSWANDNKKIVTKIPKEADNIVILGCQVTDLAVLNDFRVLEDMQERFPSKRFLMGGCLGQRLDIDTGVERIEPLRSDYTFIKDKGLVAFEKPFWVKDFKEDGEINEKQGNLFRNHYPLRIGVGCDGNCDYCTIKKTRLGSYQLDPVKLKEEMIFADSNGHSILLIADNPKFEQLIELIEFAVEKEIFISLRNIEPMVLCKLFSIFSEFANPVMRMLKNNLLDYCHSPLQSLLFEVLNKMNRSFAETTKAFSILKTLRSHYNVKTATNVIIDYKDIPDNSYKILQKEIDYVSWNPLWDGKWDRGEAEKRFIHYSKNF